MTNDIVTRLRRVAQQKIEGHAVTPSPKQLLDACDEIKRLRAAIDSLLHDIDTDHIPDETGRMCRTCGAGDGSWPCVHRMALDELKEARRG